jgi:type II secretory pathway component PulF
MLQYAATVRLSNGQTVVYNVRASDRQTAARELALTPSRVLSVSVDWFATLMAVSVTSKGPSQTEQAIFLLNIAAQMTSGKRSTREVFDSYLSRDKRFVIDRAKYANAMNIEDFLDALGFSVNVQLLAKAGSDSGDLPTALKEAAEFLQEEEARKGAIAKRVAGGIFYSVAAVAMAIFGSMGFSNQLKEMENDIGIPFEYNLASETMFAVDWFFSTYWVFVVALLGVAFIFRKEILAAADNWPVLAQINRITRIQRGINFLSLFSLLRRSGKTDPDALHYMATNSTGPDVAIYNELASVTSRGRPLHEGLRDKDWSPTILAGLGELEEMDAESAHVTMKAILGGQKQELAKAGESLATTLQLTGMISLVATILIVIIGFLLPILSVTTTPNL